ncbi:MAG: glycosyltransferase family 1 protein [Gemmiger sp.]|uniref:glycosyltransferase family 1 protein n=1 Tax=Gemmiger sp. TaxID=2049027 RepID=UPI002E772ECA|nr:glycosyltransferase family 1 protein [Gemmiger sp.]MEE0799893.1 glycosyltransferase family 1 protein [Gemmiger sp.]
MSVRILQIVTYMGRGGLETMLMNYYRHIDREKVQFDFLVHRDFEADYDQEIRQLGGRIFHISRLIPWSRSYRTELKTFFLEHPEYSIVHVHQDCLSSVALQCAEECNIPIRIAHSHSSGAVKNFKYPIKRYYMTKIPKYATNLFACGQQAGKWMFGGTPFQVVPNAIDVQAYRYSAECALKIRKELGLEDNIVIGHVGNFTPAKNHEFLLEIFQSILAAEPRARLLLVGGGAEREHIREKGRTLGIGNKVILTGVRSDVNELMQAMDVFVFPSHYEGLPVTMVEAQAAGLPCVISDHVPKECVVTSDLVTTMDLCSPARQWAEHILNRIETPRTDHSREIAAAGYDIVSAARKLEKFYLKKAGVE